MLLAHACQGLGEGIIPLVAHCRKAALTPDARVVPAGLVLRAVLASICTPPVAGVVLKAWDAFRWTPSYSGLELRDIPHEILSEEVVLFEFDFNEPTSLQSRLANISFPGIKNGVANAVVVYFRLNLDANSYIDTAPTAPQRTHWLQAIHFVAPVPVATGVSVPASVGHNGVDIAVDFGQEPAPAGPYDPAWLQAHDDTQALISKLTEALAGSGSEHHRTADAALGIAAQAALLGVDPHDANALALMLCS